MSPETATFTHSAGGPQRRVLIFPCPSYPLEQRQAWPQENQHVTIQAGEIPRVGRLFESPMMHRILPGAANFPGLLAALHAGGSRG